MSDIFLQVGKMKQETNHSCFFYSCGGCIARDYTTYPSAYGSRCESYNEFFAMNDGKLFPNCPTCKRFVTWDVEYVDKCWYTKRILKVNLPNWIQTDEEMQEFMKAFDGCRNSFEDEKADLWKQFATREEVSPYQG